MAKCASLEHDGGRLSSHRIRWHFLAIRIILLLMAGVVLIDIKQELLRAAFKDDGKEWSPDEIAEEISLNG